MPTYKLYYFDSEGRGETARMLFELSGTPYEDIRLSGDKWKEAKPGMPMEQMPVLEVDGDLIGQSAAIYSYLAREFGLYGKDSMQTFKIDEILGCMEDITQPLIRLFMEKDEARKETMKTEFKDKQLPEWEVKFEKVLTKYEDKYGKKAEVTLAEIGVHNILKFFSYIDGASVKSDKIQAFSGKVMENPTLKQYIEKKQEAKK